MTLKTVALLGLTFLLNSAFYLSAQPTPADIAEEEAVRRQEAIQLLRMKLLDAQALQKSSRFIEAAKVYEDAYSLFPRSGDAGATLAEDKKLVRSGLVETRLKLADEARLRGDLQEADAQVKRALKVDSQNAAALAFKLQNDKAIASSKGNIPSSETLSRIPEFQNERIQTGTLVQDGKLLFEMGKLDDAEAKLGAALQQDPSNVGAKYYLDLIKEKRYLQAARARDTASKDKMVEVEDAWVPSPKNRTLPFPNPALRTNLVHTSPQRQEIVAKLNSIRLNEVGYDGLPLVEVLKHLTDESIKRDPDKAGLNFMINPHSDVAADFSAPVTDPSAPVTLTEAVPAVDVASVTVKINPPLRNLRLLDVLDAVVTAAEEPIRYELRDYAIVFSPRPPEQVQLMLREFRVDPNTFVQGLESVIALGLGETISQGSRGGGGGGQDQGVAFNVPRVQLAQIISGGGGGGGQSSIGLKFVTVTNTTASLNDIVRAYFTTTGVNLDPPKSVFFNDRTGILLVRATAEDLATIEAAVHALNVSPPQVRIQSKIAEVTQLDSKALGFDWFLGNLLLGGRRIASSGGSAPSYNGTPTTANPSGIFPGPGFGPGIPGPGTIFPAATDGQLSSSLRNTVGIEDKAIPALGTITGVLTDPQFRLVIRALEQRGGLDVLSSPEVTTLSGRQAQMAMLDLRKIVTDVESNQQSTTQPTGGNNVIQNVQSQFTFTSAVLPFGPSIDVIPYVCADGYTIQMTMIPSLTEFVGYDDPGSFVPVAATAFGTPLTAVLPLPHIRLRQVTTSCIVYDGQTVVLGGLISENLKKIKDKVPMLGDIPYVGRLFRSESQTSDKRNLVIFVTPTIIDPAGNRVHSDEDLPFARTAIPSQSVPATTAQ